MELKSKFIKVRCPKCKNEQIVFSNASSKILCLVCQEILAVPRGGKTDIKADVLEILS